MFKVLWKDKKNCVYLAAPTKGVWSKVDSLPPIGWEFNHMVPYVGGIPYKVIEIKELESELAFEIIIEKRIN
jgi:hypothetical protein